MSRDAWTPIVFADKNPASDGKGNLIDGNLATRWSSGEYQAPGEWIAFDFGAPRKVNALLLCNRSEADYPRGLELYLSTDGSSWVGPVAAQGGTQDRFTTILFPMVEVQYVKVVQTGSAAANWWSVHEVYAFAFETDESGVGGEAGAVQAGVDLRQAAGGGTAAKVSLANLTTVPVEAVCVIGVYAPDGRLKATSARTVSAAAFQAVSESLASPAMAEGDTAKAFLWDAATLAPLCEADGYADPVTPITKVYAPDPAIMTMAGGCSAYAYAASPTGYIIGGTDSAGCWFQWDGIEGYDGATRYEVSFTYGSGYVGGKVRFDVSMNGQPAGAFEMPGNTPGGWGQIAGATASATLPALFADGGRNQLRFAQSQGGANISRLTVTAYFD
jgi:hypothetical protein